MFPYRWEYVWTKLDLFNRLRVVRRPKASLKQLGYKSKMVGGSGRAGIWIVTKDKIAIKPHENPVSNQT